MTQEERLSKKLMLSYPPWLSKIRKFLVKWFNTGANRKDRFLNPIFLITFTAFIVGVVFDLFGISWIMTVFGVLWVIDTVLLIGFAIWPLSWYEMDEEGRKRVRSYYMLSDDWVPIGWTK